MRAISLWQPYASAIALGLKTNETRGYHTSVRGTVAIHAAKKVSLTQKRFFEVECLGSEPYASRFKEARLYSFSMLPKGCVVAVADLVGCERAEAFSGPEALPLSDEDRLLGDYSPGRWIWRLQNVRALPQPYFVAGHQGWFEVSDRVVEMKPIPAHLTEGLF